MKSLLVVIGLAVSICSSFSAHAANHVHPNNLLLEPPVVKADISYDDVRIQLKDLEAANPTTTKVISLGVSDSGLPIEGIKVGNGPIKDLVVGTHHGNEYGGTYLALGFAKDLSAKPIAGKTVYVIPVLNIGGFNKGQRNEASDKNSSMLPWASHDPNRDYPGPCGSGEGKAHKLKSTKLLADFVAKENIVTSATIHTYWPTVAYPWGMGSKFTDPYLDIFKKLVADATAWSNYQTGNSMEILYSADGTFEDYAFWKHGIWSLLFEVGTSHWPSKDDIEHIIKVNVPGIRKMLENAPRARAEKHDYDGVCNRNLPQRRWE